MYSILHYVVKFVSYSQQVGGFFPVSSTNKTDHHDITDILLKVALNSINQPIHWLKHGHICLPISSQDMDFHHNQCLSFLFINDV
jgi:hypothetical protein